MEFRGWAEKSLSFRSMTVEENVRSLAAWPELSAVSMKTGRDDDREFAQEVGGAAATKDGLTGALNDAPISAPFPDCKRIAPIMRKQINT